MEKDANLVVPALVEVIEAQPDPRATWMEALPLLQRIGPKAEKAIPALLQRLKAPEGVGGLGVSLTLVAIGPPAVDPLLHVLSTPLVKSPGGRATTYYVPDVHDVVALVLGLIGNPAVEPATERLESMHANIRVAGCRALTACGPAARSL